MIEKYVEYKKAIIMKQYILIILVSWNMSLIAQPVWNTPTILNSAGIDASSGLVMDAEKSQYWTGTYGADLTIDGQTLPLVGQEDIFLTKLDSNGTVLWLERMGGLDKDKVANVAINSQDEPHIAGLFWDNAIFDTINLQATIHPNALFVAKYTTTGQVIWATAFKGKASKVMTDITIDAVDNIYCTGYFSDSLFIGNDTLISVGMEDLFVVKMDSQGNVLWTRQAGYQQQTRAREIAVNSLGEIWIGGEINGRVIFGQDTLWAETIDWDIFLVRYNASGAILNSKRLGGIYNNFLNELSLKNDNIYLVGNHVGLIQFDGISLQSNQFDSDIFIAKLDDNGQVIWAKGLGGSANDFGTAIAVGDSRILVGGYYENSTTIDNQTFTTSFGDQNGILLEIDENGQINWVQEWSGTQPSFVTNLSVYDDLFGVSGDFIGDVNVGNTTLTSNGFTDLFVAIFKPLHTSTEQQENINSKAVVFPNPTTEYISIQFIDLTLNIDEIIIFNNLGNILMQKNTLNSNDKLNINHLPTGLYFVQIKTEKGIIIKSFVKH